MLQPDPSLVAARNHDVLSLISLNDPLTWHDGQTIQTFRENDSIYKFAQRLQSHLRAHYQLRTIMEERQPDLINNARAFYHLAEWVDPLPDEFKNLRQRVSWVPHEMPEGPLDQVYRRLFIIRPILRQTFEFAERLSTGKSIIDSQRLRSLFTEDELNLIQKLFKDPWWNEYISLNSQAKSPGFMFGVVCSHLNGEETGPFSEMSHLSDRLAVITTKEWRENVHVMFSELVNDLHAFTRGLNWKYQNGSILADSDPIITPTEGKTPSDDRMPEQLKQILKTETSSVSALHLKLHIISTNLLYGSGLVIDFLRSGIKSDLSSAALPGTNLLKKIGADFIESTTGQLANIAMPKVDDAIRSSNINSRLSNPEFADVRQIFWKLYQAAYASSDLQLDTAEGLLRAEKIMKLALIRAYYNRVDAEKINGADGVLALFAGDGTAGDYYRADQRMSGEGIYRFYNDERGIIGTHLIESLRISLREIGDRTEYDVEVHGTFLGREYLKEITEDEAERGEWLSEGGQSVFIRSLEDAQNRLKLAKNQKTLKNIGFHDTFQFDHDWRINLRRTYLAKGSEDVRSKKPGK